jgi:hypothetical protein
VFGFEVMMFNWIVVNFVVSGPHSYAWRLARPW